MADIYDFISRSRKILLLTFIYFVLSLTGILHHEIWLDEAQHYLIARDSNTLSGLIYACRNEGHPLLWNILLFIITRFSPDLFCMQLLHVMINCLAVIIISKSNLSTPEKILVVFGYFLFYEYNIISRNYGISALLIFLLVQQYIRNKGSIMRLAVIILFLANTHLFSLLFSVAFVMAYIINNKGILSGQNKKTLVAAMLIVLAGWMISAYYIIPPENYGFRFVNVDSSGYFSTERIVKTMSVCLKGIFYIPDYTVPGHHFENSLYYLTLNLKNWQIYFLSIISIVIPAIIVKSNRFAFALYCTFLLVFLPVYFFLPLVHGIRYFGFLYIVFICCYWIARPHIPKVWLKLSIAIFALQFINGIYAYSMDLYWPFSEARNVSNYLREIRKYSENVFILNLTLRPAISAYSEEKYFGVENGKSLSYCLWGVHLPDSVLKSKLNAALNHDSTSIIITNDPFRGLIDSTKLVMLKSFNDAILKGENATVYRYRK